MKLQLRTENRLTDKLLDAVYSAGEHAKRHAFNLDYCEFKSRDDPVTNIDRECEEMIMRDMGDGYNYLGEEFGKTDNQSKFTIMTDPIDGTKSYVKGEFDTSTTAMIVHSDTYEPISSAVYDFMKNIMYVADSDGAFLIDPQNKHHKIPRQIPEFKRQFVMSTKPQKFETKYEHNLDDYLIDQQKGSVALSMAKVAASGIPIFHSVPYKKDGLMDIGDILAGIHILEKSGYAVTDAHFNPLDKTTLEDGILAVKPGYTLNQK